MEVVGSADGFISAAAGGVAGRGVGLGPYMPARPPGDTGAASRGPDPGGVGCSQPDHRDIRKVHRLRPIGRYAACVTCAPARRFTPAGAILKGFAHEAPMSPYNQEPPIVWPGVLDSVPPIFADFLQESAFSLEDTTFCLWRTYHDNAWQRGPIHYPTTDDPDGVEHLLALFDQNPQTYQRYAEDYYERPVSLQAIIHFYEYRPLTPAVVAELNEALTLEELQEDIDEIQYPS
jgi:hypothetical protein